LADRLQQMADRASLAGQQRVTQDAAQAHVAAESQVAQTQETQNEEVEAEARRRNPFVGRRRRREQGDDSEEDRKDSGLGGVIDSDEHHIDVTI
jgi:hypothetical protein